MPAIATITVWDGTHPTAVSRTFAEKGSSGGVATWMYAATSSMAGWPKIVLTRVKNSAKSMVRTFKLYVYVPKLATVNGIDILDHYSDCTVIVNAHKNAVTQELRDVCAFPASVMVKPETMAGGLADAVINDAFPS